MKVSKTEKEFNQLIYDNQTILHKICNVYCAMEADKEDLFQEMVINLWKGFTSFRQQSSFSTWMYRVALNTAISQKRKTKNRFGIKMPLGNSLPDDDGTEVLEKETQMAALYKGIYQLKKIEKAIILLYLEEKSYQEISSITGLSKSNVSVKLVRIKTKLEKLVKAILSKSEYHGRI